MRWCCFRNGGIVPKYGDASGESAVLTPKGGVWDEVERIDADFALKICLLTPVKAIDYHTGWSAAFVHGEAADVGILYACRLDSPGNTMTFPLPFPGNGTYGLRDYDTGETVVKKAEVLRKEGVAIFLNERFRARILICE